MACKSLLLLGIVLSSLLLITQDVAATTNQFTNKANEPDGKNVKPTGVDVTNEEKMGHRQHGHYGGGGYGGGYGGGVYGGGYGGAYGTVAIHQGMVGMAPMAACIYGHYRGHGGRYGGAYDHYPAHGGGYGHYPGHGGGYGHYPSHGGGWH